MKSSGLEIIDNLDFSGSSPYYYRKVKLRFFRIEGFMDYFAGMRLIR